MNKLLVAPSPHIHSGNTTSKLMRGVLIALLPTMVVSVIYYGWAAVYITAVAVASCVGFEWLIEKFLMKKPSTISDGSAVLTGVLLSFNLPVSVPAWLVVLGSLFAIGVAKMSYGGLGRNLFNPALAGRVFLLISFPVMMTTFPLSLRNSPLDNQVIKPFTIETNFLSTDAVSGATPLAQARAAVANGEDIDQAMNNIPISEMLLGNKTGSFGEVATLALLLGFLYMLYKKIITWHIPIYILGTMFVFSSIFWFMDSYHYINPLFQILTGGALLGAIFMATDYVTSPMTRIGMIIYAVMIGIITILIRTWGGYPEGISFAILLMNAATPLLNKIKPPKFGKNMKSSLTNMVIVLASITTLTAAAVGYVYKVTKEPIARTKDKKISAALQEVLPAFKTLEEPVMVKAFPDDTQEVKVYQAKDGDKIVGYAVESYTMNGYSGEIKVLVGFDANKAINKIAVIAQSETPGLGAKIADNAEPFVVQFQGKDPQSFKLSVKADGGDVDAITASTITSKAYVDAVNRAYESVKNNAVSHE